MRDLKQHPEVEAEVESHAVYLFERSDRAPFAFVDEVQAAFSRIRQQPTLFHFTYREYRRCNLPRFSHSIIYRVQEAAIYVIAVMHEKRHPDYWKHRIQDDQD